jgi:hypothetical protein
MSEIERETSTGSHQEIHSSLFLDAYNLCKDTINHPEARLRQAEVAIIGTMAGCIQEGGKEIISHPWEVTGKVAVAGATGAALGIAAAAESPIIASGAIGVCVIGTGASLWHTYSSLSSNKDFQNSMDAVYKSGDQPTLNTSISTASNAIGPEAFNYAIGLTGGLGGLFHPKLSASISTIPYVAELSQYFRPKLTFGTAERYSQYIPMPKPTGSGTVEMYFKDGSTLHAHPFGNTAMLRAGGVEYVVNTNKNGIDLAAFVSPTGRQIVKGLSQEKLPLELYIDTIAGRTKVTGYGKTSEYLHSPKDNKSWEWFASCRKCNPVKKPKGGKSK